MLDHRQLRRVVTFVGAAAVAVAIIAPVTSAFAARSRSATPRTAFALAGSVAGSIKTIQSGQTLTFVFTESNKSNASASEDLDLTKVSNVTVSHAGQTCVLASGVAINPDGPGCEPGFVKPGQRASMVLTTIAGATGANAMARVCLFNESNSVKGPCLSVSIKIA